MPATSKQDLDDFLDFLGQKGLAPKSTISARKASVNKVLGILDPEEQRDVLSLDLDEVAQRFANLEGKSYTPDSLKSYVSRARVAIDDFRRYVDDPLSFKPKGSSSGKQKQKTESAARTTTLPPVNQAQHPASMPKEFEASILPIPIREDLVVKVYGLPFDLTESEANKIASVVKAMAL